MNLEYLKKSIVIVSYPFDRISKNKKRSDDNTRQIILKELLKIVLHDIYIPWKGI